MEQTEKKFPSEVINLPSDGYFYAENHPLKSGTVEIAYMTAKHEDILTSRNLIQKGIVLDKLLESLILTKGVSVDDLLIGDKNALLIASRILAYGKNYDIEYMCQSCSSKESAVVDLQSLYNKTTDFSVGTKHINSIEYTLPISEVKVGFRFLTSRDEKEIDQILVGLKKIGIESDLTTRLKQSIISINGNPDRKVINNFIDNNLLAQDSLALRKYMNLLTPDVNLKQEFKCTSCGNTKDYLIPISADFFWPASWE